MNFAATSVLHGVTFSVIPSDSIMIMYAPASMKRFACMMAQPGSRVPSASNSAAAVAPPAPNWMPTSGLGLRPAHHLAIFRASLSPPCSREKPAQVCNTDVLQVPDRVRDLVAQDLICAPMGLVE